MNIRTGFIGFWIVLSCPYIHAEEKSPRAFINGQGPGWVTLGEKNFADVNGTEDTWKFEGALIKGTGVPIGVMRTAKQYKNLEMVLQWRHLKEAGNSGVFVWVMEIDSGAPPGRVDFRRGHADHSVSVAPASSHQCASRGTSTRSRALAAGHSCHLLFE